MALTGKKSATAFKNIREVSEELDVPQHVLRFWESKFSEVRPLKRGGRRRYYRPEDLALLKTIRDLLYVQGYKIRGVQRLLREGKVTTVDSVVTVAPADELEAEGLGPTGLALDDDEPADDESDGAPAHGDDMPSYASHNQPTAMPPSEQEYERITVAEMDLNQLSRVQNRLMAARTKLLSALQSTDLLVAAR